MYILAIETTGAFASVALLEDDRIIGYVEGSDRFSHLQNLMPQVDAVVKENKLSLNDIAAIAVSCGPGSFTGIRIGVSSARALSQVLGIPCVAVSSLEALAMRGAKWLASCNNEENEEDITVDDAGQILICPILDARRSQVYGGGYFMKDGYPVEEIKAGPYTIDEFLSKAEGYSRILLLGDGVDACASKIEEMRPDGVITAPEAVRYQTAGTVALIGAKLFTEKGGCSYNELEPDYMRLAEAERKLKEKQKG